MYTGHIPSDQIRVKPLWGPAIHQFWGQGEKGSEVGDASAVREEGKNRNEALIARYEPLTG